MEEPYTPDDDTLIDLGPEDQWITPTVTNAVNALMEALYGEGCNINPTTITVSGIPGDVATIHSDYGTVTIKGSDDE